MAPTRSAAARPGAKGYDPARGAKVIAWGRAFLDQIAPLARRFASGRQSLFRRKRRLATPNLPTAASARLAEPAGFAGYLGPAVRARAPAAGSPRPACRNPHRPHAIRSARPMRRASPTSCWKSALTTIMDCEDSVAAVDAEDKVLRLSQLARPDDRATCTASSTRAARRSTRRLDAGPDLSRARRRRRDPARPQPDAGAQCRSSDDQRRDPADRRQRDPRRHLDACHQPDRAARPARHGRAPQQPHRLDLYRQAEDARPRRSRFRRPTCSRGSRICWGWPRNTIKIGIMDEERRTTVNLPHASAPRRTASSSSIPASSTAPATKSTPRWKPGRWSARAT